MKDLRDKYSSEEILHAAANILCDTSFPFKPINGSVGYYDAGKGMYAMKIQFPYTKNPYFAFVLANSPEEACDKLDMIGTMSFYTLTQETT